METLSGVPVFGKTAYGAFYHHIPHSDDENGLGMIIYAPHVGLSKNGVYGELERPGVSEMGKSCGANFAILGKWDNNDNDFNDDSELERVNNSIIDYKNQILESKDPIVEIAKKEYDVGLDMIVSGLSDIQNKEKHKIPVLVVSGIHIDRRDDKNLFVIYEIGLVDKGEYKKLYYNLN
jgi:hypothetical protein